MLLYVITIISCKAVGMIVSEEEYMMMIIPALF
jgi:hypothetical protein